MQSAISESDKGTKFERLMKAYLRIDPVFADQFSDVWLWSEWPGNGGKHDTGIDLVAKDRNTGHLRRHPVQVLRADHLRSPSR